MVGSVDRHAQPDQPDPAGPAGRPDAARERPKSPHETEAQLAERLDLPALTRAGAYESLYARAMAQDAPFRERLAREEAAGKRESLSQAGESRAPQDPSKPPIDKPERDLETTRNYWTEVPSFLSLWRDHVGRWPWINRLDNRTINPEQQAAAADSMRGLFQAEPSISDNVRAIGAHDRRSWLEGFDFRMKSGGGLWKRSLKLSKRAVQMPPYAKLCSRFQTLFVTPFACVPTITRLVAATLRNALNPAVTKCIIRKIHGQIPSTKGSILDG